MANTITQKTLFEGNRKVQRQISVEYVDTATESNVVIFDASTFTGPDGVNPPSKASVLDIQYDVAPGVKVDLKFDATTDVLAVVLQEGSGLLDYNKVGGLHNTAGTGVTGDVLFNATGLGAGDSVNLIITFKLKK